MVASVVRTVDGMRFETSATCISWIPSEAVTGVNRAVFDSGFTHYDPPPPAEIDDIGGAGLVALRDRDGFRFANHLAVWIDTLDGRIVDAGYSGSGMMGATTVAVRGRSSTFEAVAFEDLRHPVEIAEDGSTATFVQTVGGHTALPAPRLVARPPFVAYRAPIVWSTLELTVDAAGSGELDLIGASRFPRHWVYDASGALCAKAGLADFAQWWHHSFGSHTPWGDEDNEVLVTEVESALERELSGEIMHGATPPVIRTLCEGERLVEQGDAGGEIFLLLDGVLAVDVGGRQVAEVGPGAILGERAVNEGGRRTSTLRALTAVRVAVVDEDRLQRDMLGLVGERHRREDVDGATR